MPVSLYLPLVHYLQALALALPLALLLRRLALSLLSYLESYGPEAAGESLPGEEGL